MGWSVRELKCKLSSVELMEWVAYYEVEPWGSKIDGLRTASNTAAVYNAGLMNADPKRLKTQPFLPDHFYIGVSNDKKPASRDWKDRKRMFTKIFGEAKKE